MQEVQQARVHTPLPSPAAAAAQEGLRAVDALNARPLPLEDALVAVQQVAGMSRWHAIGVRAAPLRLLLPGWRCGPAALFDFGRATRELEVAVAALLDPAGGCCREAQGGRAAALDSNTLS